MPLRDKPAAFVAVSASGTVPCLVTPDRVLDESRDIMVWALERSDPEGWLEMPREGHAWIDRIEGDFKYALDRTKYPDRYPGADPSVHRAAAEATLRALDRQIAAAPGPWLHGRPTLADHASLPFVRQFAMIDRSRFDAGPWPALRSWLDAWLASDAFTRTMAKYPLWCPDAEETPFPPGAARDTPGRPGADRES